MGYIYVAMNKAKETIGRRFKEDNMIMNEFAIIEFAFICS